MRKICESEKDKVRILLRFLREKTGMRQVDLAQRLDRPQSFVSKYESGERNLDFVEVREVCLALGIPLVDFVRHFEEIKEIDDDC